MTEMEVDAAALGPAAFARDFDDAFPTLFRGAYRVAYRLLGDREEAADVAQEACTRACMRWRRLVRGGDPTPWVVRVAGNLAIDRWRRRRTVASHPLAAATPTTTPDRVDLHRALDRLSRRQREVVVLRYFADLPEAAVAAAVGCSVGAVKQHASRALAALRAELTLRDEET